MRSILILLLLWAKSATAQTPSNDTISVWVIYMDSVRIFAAYPEIEMRLEVEAGWLVEDRRIWFGNYNQDQYFDLDGRPFNPEMVLMTKPRVHKKSAFPR